MKAIDRVEWTAPSCKTNKAGAPKVRLPLRGSTLTTSRCKPAWIQTSSMQTTDVNPPIMQSRRSSRAPSTSYSSRSTSYNPTTTYNASTTDNVETSHRTSYATQNGSSTSYPYNTTTQYETTTTSRPHTARRSTGRPGTSASRPRTGYSTLGMENQEIVSAISESRGISPVVGLAFINLDTGEAVLSQLNDSQTYVKTTYKITVFQPSCILIVGTAASPKSKLFSIIEENLDVFGANIILLDRNYWSEKVGVEYIEHLAFHRDVDSIKTATSGNYYAVCCFAAALRYIELGLAKKFSPHSLRISYQPSEGSMTIDIATIQSLELVQNLHNPKSKDCLFGLLNQTKTPMGPRTLRSNILQPVTDAETLGKRYDAVEELSTKEPMFFAVKQALSGYIDADKVLTKLILLPAQAGICEMENAINNVLALKKFVCSAEPVSEALSGARTEMLQIIRSNCAVENVGRVLELIDHVINEDTIFASKPLDMRNQRIYAVKSGVNGLLDVARQTYKESTDDTLQYMKEIADEHNLPLQIKFDRGRQYFFSLHVDELEGRNMPEVFINVYRKKKLIECQTLYLVKQNQKISDAHCEVVLMSDESTQDLIASVREHMFGLFKISESVAMLDMLFAFAHLVSSKDYVRPLIGQTLAIRAGRHPIREQIQSTKFIPNDVYATQQNRFQVITGANMSGKSTYIRTVALMTIMEQVGSFVPAQHASFPIVRQLFARISIDDSIEANVSTFAAEMREAAFILRNIDTSSMVIIDELGRGTSTRDGMAIALAIAESLVESRALVWFATHFRDLAQILAERPGVVSLHLAVDMQDPNTMSMLYKLAQGTSTDTHYGLALAKVVPLPADVVERAEHIAFTLEAQMMKKQKSDLKVLIARRRKLMLNLREHLTQAQTSTMSEEELKDWLRELQREFVTRMVTLDEEKKAIDGEGGDEEFLDDAMDVDVEEGGISLVGTEEESTGESTCTYGDSYDTRKVTTTTETS